MTRELPTRVVEDELFDAGASLVAGIDEVGRGAWAGPLSVGVAVFTSAALDALPEGVADSKLLTPGERQALFPDIASVVVAYAVGHVLASECDEWGMTRAQRVGAQRALDQLGCQPDAVLVDGRFDFSGHPGARVLVGADRLCRSVAAASVLAKVTRDALMIEHAPAFPDYAFDQNKGYPSPTHRAAIARVGLCELHRASWAFADGLEVALAGQEGPDRL